MTGIIKHSKISVYLHIQLGSISVWALMAAGRFRVGHFLRLCLTPGRRDSLFGLTLASMNDEFEICIF